MVGSVLARNKPLDPFFSLSSYQALTRAVVFTEGSSSTLADCEVVGIGVTE